MAMVPERATAAPCLRRAAAPLAAALLSAMLVPAGAAGADPPLAGTRWQLVEIQSMDDTVGVSRPSDPSHYTLRFDDGEQVSLRLDCNLARGSWEVRPSSDPDSGSLRFGPLATTRRFCPPPSLGDRLASQLSFVRSYLLKDGRLHLSLLADGGILVWQPLENAGFLNTPDPALEAALRRQFPDYLGAAAEGGSGSSGARYVYGTTDLDGDGTDELFVYLMGSYFCGTGGCTLQLYRRTGEGVELLGQFPTSRLPIIVSSRRSNGWHDFWRLQSGGGMPATYVRLAHDGQRYVEKERIPADEKPDGSLVLGGEPLLADGAPLDPAP